MATTRPGVDRITKQQLQGHITMTEALMAQHMEQCPVCIKAANTLRLRCGSWWDAARYVHRMRRMYRQYRTNETGNQPLFTAKDMP